MYTSPCLNITAQKMKFSIKIFFSKCDQICSLLRIWSHLLNKCLIENFIFSAVYSLIIIQPLLNPFHATGLFLYHLKTSENQRFSDIFWEYRKRPMA